MFICVLQKISELTALNEEQENKILELKEKIRDRTPLKSKINVTPLNTPKTPKTPIKCFAGKENRSPAPMALIGSPLGVLRQRNN